MAQRLKERSPSGGTTDHSEEISQLRGAVTALDQIGGLRTTITYQAMDLAADLLEMHDQTGISLDSWPAARALVETLTGKPIVENGA